MGLSWSSDGDTGNNSSETSSVVNSSMEGRFLPENNSTKSPYDLKIQNNGTVPSNGTSSEDFNFNIFGYDVYPLRWLTSEHLYYSINLLSSICMVAGCILPYIPQYLTIYRSHNSSGFSTYVCLTLLIANISRVAFWFGRRFELPLLIQSAIMIVAQILLLELCVRVRRDTEGPTLKKKTFFMCDYRCFWAWTDILSYIEFLCLFSALIGAAMYIFNDYPVFVNMVGLFSALTESMLGLPQAIKNYRKKSVLGMSLSMVLMWLAGDTFKTAYYIVNEAPYQFLVCGTIQITIDLLILFQVCLYRQNAPIKFNCKGERAAQGNDDAMI